MVLFGMRFYDTREDIKKYAEMIRVNSESKSAMSLFNVKVFVPEHDVIMVWKEFIPLKTMLMGLGLMGLISLIPALIWQVITPLIIICTIVGLLMFVESPSFNFLLMRKMVKRAGYKDKVRMIGSVFG